MTSVTTLILPGLSNSGPEHWQSYWERMDPRCRRVEQLDWETPRCADWVATLAAAVARAEGEVVLVGHSSSCALIAHWAESGDERLVARVRGALLVAPSDPEGPNYPAGPTGFAPMPRKRLPFPSTVVASEDDMYVGLAQAHAYAMDWGSAFVNLGAAGHINSSSGLGAWPSGYALLETLRTSVNRQDGSP
jgi:predicted alpha/beta hydrolase family esterase